jgi:pimeloyl-ACP methyl ester carboxylesterase
MKRLFILLCAGCAAIAPPRDFRHEEIQTESFRIAAWHKITDPALPVKVYIEGDGAAFRPNGAPTNNPTPKSKLVRELAFGDDSPNVVYLARPCQFVSDSACNKKHWSSERFSEPAVQAEAEALRTIAPGARLVLIGYSGGAQIAMRIAPKLQTEKIITIAGNLDLDSWTEFHNLPSLAHSGKVEISVPAMHFVGENDRVIPPEITIGFVKNPFEITVVKKAGHGTGFESIYPFIWSE